MSTIFYKQLNQPRVPIGQVEFITSECYVRNHDLVNCYGISMSKMTTFRSFPHLWLVTGFVVFCLIVLCKSLFVLFRFGHCVSCYSDDSPWISSNSSCKQSRSNWYLYKCITITEKSHLSLNYLLFSFVFSLQFFNFEVLFYTFEMF